MKAADIMVSNVITVGPDTLVHQVADVMLRNRISGVPVVGSAGELLGIVSEGDLIRRPEAQTERKHSWWLDLFVSREVLIAEYIKTHAFRVTDVMTRNVITATPDTSASEIASLLEKHNIKRVPIVEKGKIVGIVSRANLLQALASLKQTPSSSLDDAGIRSRLLGQLLAEQWTTPSLMNVIVHDGTVELWGIVDSRDEKKAIRILAEGTPGVRDVNDNLIVRPAGAYY
jgi:CBS domain-containing protein